ncbi:MAG TPA: hypothetical protein VEF76_10625 [Patescibacteria group bacterium]|nr:hypothetical protein [Patescibacteria group bacterium]
MTLLPELQESVDRATRGSFKGLHQVIAGPSPSGKTTQARAYIEALRQKGSSGNTAIFTNAVDWRNTAWMDIENAFKNAKGGVLVIDELEKAEPAFQRIVTTRATQAIEDGDTLLIFTGAPEILDVIRGYPGLHRRLNAPIVLTRQFTEDDMEEFSIQRQQIENQRRTAALRQAEWKEAKDEDLRPHKKMAAPKTARFRRGTVPQ